jgi:hypothetical protein
MWKQRKLRIDQQRADAYERMTTAQANKADLQAAEAKNEISQLEQQDAFLKKAGGTTLQTNFGEMSLFNTMMLQKLGLPIAAAEGDKVVDTFADDEGNVRALVVRNGKVDITDQFEDLQGFEKMPSKETEVRLGPEAQSEARTMGTQKAKVKSADWLAKQREALMESDQDFYFQWNSPEPEEQQQAVTKLRRQVQQQLDSLYDNKVVFGKKDGKVGYYTVDENGEPIKRLRGDVK